MSRAPRVFGLILAGGRSSRFGREKAVEPFGGRPLIDWVADVLAPATVRLAVSAKPSSAAAAYAAERGLPCLADLDRDPVAGGPLAGVLQGLRWAESQALDVRDEAWLATAPCDAPLLPKYMVERLVASRSPGGAVARTSEGLQPLCALWPVTASATLAALNRHPPIRQVLESVGAIPIDFADAQAFANLNRPQDLTAIQSASAPLCAAPDL